MTLKLYIACLHAVFVQRRRDEEQGVGEDREGGGGE